MSQRLRWGLAALLCSMGVAWAQGLVPVPAKTVPPRADVQQHIDSAYQAYGQRDYAQALQQAKLARRLRPDMVSLQELVLMAQTAAEQGATPLSAQPDASQQARALAQKAYEKVMESRADANLISWARSYIWQALQFDSQPLAWHVLAVRLAMAQGQWADAIFGADQALAIHPGEPALLQAKAFALLQKDQSQQALQLLQQTLAQGGLSSDDRNSLLLQAADTALQAGQFAYGLQQAQRLLDGQVPGAQARQQLLKAGVPLALNMLPPELGCNEQSICAARYALDMEQALVKAAHQAAQQGRWPQVQAVATQLVQLQSKHGLYWQWLIGAQLGQGLGDAARSTAAQALKALDARSSGLSAAEMVQLAQIAGQG